MSSRPSRGAARLAAILDALPDGLVLVNTNGTVVNANTIALEMFETPGTALVGRGLLDLLPSFDSRLIPGSMRRPDSADPRGRTKPTRMVARRTDGSEFPVEATSASLEDGHEAYDSYSTGGVGYSGDELLMIVVRDLSGTLDTEAELARSQRQTEMILRAASEGVVGTDTDGRIVLVNPAAAQILGWRASDLGGKELHQLMLHSRGDGEPFPYDESPLADTLRSGRKHRVRGQVVWAKDGSPVPVDLTTAPVRDGDQLVGAVLTFNDRRPYEQLSEQHAAELAEAEEKHGGEVRAYEERLAAAERRYDALGARHAQLTAVLGESLRGPLEELRRELGVLAADPAGQLWPEANQILHHLAAGYARMTTLVDNVLCFQRLDMGEADLDKAPVGLDGVVSRAVEGAVELIGPGRVQFAVHAPPIEAEVDGDRLATALAHLVADVAGVDSTGTSRVAAGGGYADSTIVVAAAQRGDVVRIEVRGPHTGGDPVHQPIVRGIVQAHGGVLQTHDVPGGGAGGSAYVVEVPVGEAAGTAAPARAEEAAGAVAPAVSGAPALPAQQAADTGGGGRRRARRASTDAFLDSPVRAEDPVAGGPTGRRRARRAADDGTDGTGEQRVPARASAAEVAVPEPTGRRRGRPSPAEAAPEAPAGRAATPAEGSVVMAGESSAQARPAGLGGTVPPQGVAPQGEAVPVPPQGTGRRARRTASPQGPVAALPPAPSQAQDAGGVPAAGPAGGAPSGAGAPEGVPPGGLPAAPVPPGALPPGALPGGTVAPQGAAPEATASAAAVPPGGLPAGAVPAGGLPAGAVPAGETASAGRRARRALAAGQERAQTAEAGGRSPFALPPAAADRADAQGAPSPQAAGPGPVPAGQPVPPGGPGGAEGRHDSVRTAPGADHTPPQPHPLPGTAARPAEGADSTQGRAFSVRTLGQGVPFAQQQPQQAAQPPAPGATPTGTPVSGSGSGRRRRLATPPEGDRQPGAANGPVPSPQPPQPVLGTPPSEGRGRAYEIGAPDEGADEGPEPLDGPGGAVEVANEPQPQPVDDELPPEPLDNPRRLLVWPAPDGATQQALSERGYRPVIVHSREEVDAQIAAFPAALFVDPLTGPITRTALQSLRQAAVAAEVPVLLAAGLGQASREAAYGADPAVLLKALAPRDSEQHPSRVLLIEEQDEIAHALTAALERRGMQVERATADTDAVGLATGLRPNLVVMDLMQVRRRRAGIIDWLRANGLLNRTPLVVYTSSGLDEAELPKLASGETVLFLAERSTSTEVQSRIVDLLAKIGTN
ncbi:PAS domain-containing protein [Streptomyces sp. MUM 203J]|uniref:PAS domain-containing protein n=1 Tax=Streptomyces sp. MUM 203J TaxID=2791990 RepID=UPI001F04837B|nr:PAS domain-containing protein [Streptomyces sp. MUM 203J]MCH0542169.1 PAS domain-containing protein [Streptomyces sp. MUM 203J]